MPAPVYHGLIEAGGTKFNVALARDGEIVDTLRIATTTPDETIGATIAWLEARAASHGRLSGVGIASFGPLVLDPADPQWGHVGATPKPGWSGADLAGRIGGALGCPVGIDTDVNGAALAEYLWGAGQGQRSLLYFTIGTGVGGGAVIDGKILQGTSHPEMGHLRLERHPDDLDFAGHCPFHGACLEGLASGPAIIARWGASLSELGPDHPGQTIIAFYLAQLACTMQAVFEPGRIILGGGVMGTPGLIERVRAKAVELGGGYFRSDANEILVAPALGDRAGLMGALALAQAAAA